MISQTKQKGFTLVELIIVIVVIAILAAIALISYNNISGRARDSQRAADANSIAQGFAIYNADKGGWPTSLADAKTKLGGSLVNIPQDLKDKLKTTAPGTGTAADDYQLLLCSDGSNPAHGIQINYWQETLSTPAAKTISAGDTSGTCAAAPAS